MKNSEFKSIITNKETIVHLLVWILFFSSINVHWTEGWFGPSNRVPPFSVLMFVFFSYLNAALLIPKFLRSKKWVTYFLVTLPLFASFELIRIGLTYLFEGSFQGLEKELIGRKSLILGTPSIFWMSMTASFGYRFTKDWIINKKTIDRLKLEKNQMQLSLLKSQIDPHFLFNNLNALDDLIDQDKEAAKDYLHRLSKLYRYSLLNMENDVVNFQKEWEFMEDYIYLIEKRFGKVYQFQLVNKIQQKSGYLIPPSALQSLIENAIKHNQGSISDPLVIEVIADDEMVHVSHKKQLKKEGVNSLGTGLNNLKNRYQLLSNQSILIKDDNWYRVSLPQIKQKS